MVGVDGSKESLEALRWAIAEGRLRSAKVRAVYAWRYPIVIDSGDPYLMGQGFEPVAADPERLLQLAETRLADAVAQVASGTDAVEREVIEGHAAEVLVGSARPDDLLVVGSRGHGGFSGLLLGSVGQACAHHSRCPVVIVRSSGDREP